jgi:hypothetical protein
MRPCTRVYEVLLPSQQRECCRCWAASSVLRERFDLAGRGELPGAEYSLNYQ